MSATPRALLLASSSRYRRELMERLDVDFEVAAPSFDERACDHRFEALSDEAFAVELARGKAHSLAQEFPTHWILAADQVAVLPGPPRELLHKPGTIDKAVEQLMRLAGRTHRLTTGVVLLDPVTGTMGEAVDVQRMTMRAFDEAEARAYVERHRPLDCVGSFRIEDAGIRLFERIEGDDYTGIIGLPLLAVCRLLRGADLL